VTINIVLSIECIGKINQFYSETTIVTTYTNYR